MCVGLNDAAAYFVGKSFGRTKLIAISPNKTWEGFIGGMVCNVITTYYFTGAFLQTEDKDFWICGNQKYNVGMFENYKCAEIHPVFLPATFDLPFEICGHT